jgi:C-terminal processing protease CtpA/Prc
MNKSFKLPLAIVLLAPWAALAGGDKPCTEPVQTCLDGMVTKLKTTGYIGVELDDTKVKTVMLVTKVMAGTPAEKAGIKEGDELYAIDGIRFSYEHNEAMNKIKVPGKEVTVTIKRKGASQDLKMTLGSMPADVMAKYIGEHMMHHTKEYQTATAKK